MLGDVTQIERDEHILIGARRWAYRGVTVCVMLLANAFLGMANERGCSFYRKLATRGRKSKGAQREALCPGLTSCHAVKEAYLNA